MTDDPPARYVPDPYTGEVDEPVVPPPTPGPWRLVSGRTFAHRGLPVTETVYARYHRRTPLHRVEWVLAARDRVLTRRGPRDNLEFSQEWAGHEGRHLTLNGRPVDWLELHRGRVRLAFEQYWGLEESERYPGGRQVPDAVRRRVRRVRTRLNVNPSQETRDG